MRMSTTLLIGLLAGLALAVGALLSPRVRAGVRRPAFVAGLLVLAAALSTASLLVSSRRAAGTGTAVSYGFPKPFLFRWRSWETAEAHAGWSALYFAGNTLVYAAALALLWMAWLALRRREP